nr:MAG TPA: hypothetical protein [Caudoviricetes sp.]
MKNLSYALATIFCFGISIYKPLAFVVCASQIPS